MTMRPILWEKKHKRLSVPVVCVIEYSRRGYYYCCVIVDHGGESSGAGYLSMLLFLQPSIVLMSQIVGLYCRRQFAFASLWVACVPAVNR